MQLTYMNAEVAALSAEYFRTVDFGSLVKDPSSYTTPLANFFELRNDMRDALATAMTQRFRGSKRHNRLLTEEKDTHLQHFFSAERKLRWQLINDRVFDLLALDGLRGTGEAELGYACARRGGSDSTV